MSDYYETGDFTEPKDVKNHVASLLKETKSVKSLIFETQGESIKDAREFSKKLLSLRLRGVKISHQFSIKVEFPKTISRQHVLDLIENMPRPVNGTAKVRVEVQSAIKDSSL